MDWGVLVVVVSAWIAVAAVIGLIFGRMIAHRDRRTDRREGPYDEHHDE